MQNIFNENKLNIKIDDINGKFKDYMIDFDIENYSIKKIMQYKYKYEYIGMVSRQTNKPNGFGIIFNEDEKKDFCQYG